MVWRREEGRDDGGEPRWRRDQMGREEKLSGRGEQQRGLALREEQVRLQSVEPRLRGRSQWCRGGGVRRAAKIDDEQDAASEAAEGEERRSGDGERPKEEGRLGALQERQERQEQDGARPRERETGRGEGAFDGSGLMQSAMQPFRASDRAAFCTAFGSFGHAPLRIEASHRQAAHILMAWRGVAWHGMAWPALWLAGSSERHACRAPTIPTFFNPSPSRLSAQPRRKAPQPGEQHADSRQARAPAAIKSQSQKNVLDSARDAGIRVHAPVRQLARSCPFPSGRLSLSLQIGRQAASPSGAADCDVRAELQTLRREACSKVPSAHFGSIPLCAFSHPTAAAKTSRRFVWHTRLQVARLRRGFLAVERAASAKLSERWHFGLRCGDRGARSRRFPHSPSRHRCSLQAGIQARCVHPPHTSQARPQSAD